MVLMRFWKEIAKIHIEKEFDGAVSNTAPVFFAQKVHGFFMQYFLKKLLTCIHKNDIRLLWIRKRGELNA